MKHENNTIDTPYKTCTCICFLCGSINVQPIGNLIQIFAAQFADTHANRNTDIIESVSDNFMIMLSK